MFILCPSCNTSFNLTWRCGCGKPMMCLGCSFQFHVCDFKVCACFGAKKRLHTGKCCQQCGLLGCDNPSCHKCAARF